MNPQGHFRDAVATVRCVSPLADLDAEGKPLVDVQDKIMRDVLAKRGARK